LEVDRLLADLAVSDDLSDIELPLADQIVGFEEVTIPSLHVDHEWFDRWGGHTKEQTVVEAGVSISVTIVSVGLLLVGIGDERLDIHIRGPLPIFHGHALALEDRKTNLELVLWLALDVPDFADIA